MRFEQRCSKPIRILVQPRPSSKHKSRAYPTPALLLAPPVAVAARHELHLGVRTDMGTHVCRQPDVQICVDRRIHGTRRWRAAQKVESCTRRRRPPRRLSGLAKPQELLRSRTLLIEDSGNPHEGSGGFQKTLPNLYLELLAKGTILDGGRLTSVTDSRYLQGVKKTGAGLATMSAARQRDLLGHILAHVLRPRQRARSRLRDTISPSPTNTANAYFDLHSKSPAAICTASNDTIFAEGPAVWTCFPGKNLFSCILIKQLMSCYCLFASPERISVLGARRSGGCRPWPRPPWRRPRGGRPATKHGPTIK